MMSQEKHNSPSLWPTNSSLTRRRASALLGVGIRNRIEEAVGKRRPRRRSFEDKDSHADDDLALL